MPERFKRFDKSTALHLPNAKVNLPLLGRSRSKPDGVCCALSLELIDLEACRWVMVK